MGVIVLGRRDGSICHPPGTPGLEHPCPDFSPALSRSPWLEYNLVHLLLPSSETRFFSRRKSKILVSIPREKWAIRHELRNTRENRGEKNCETLRIEPNMKRNNLRNLVLIQRLFKRRGEKKSKRHEDECWHSEICGPIIAKSCKFSCTLFAFLWS